MSKIAFVSPWYGDNIPGGAETALRGIILHLKEAGVDIEVLTTCVQQFTADWNKNYYKSGVDNVGGIPVRRFKVRKRDTKAFDRVNAKLIQGQKVTPAEEEVFMQEMVNSPALYKYIADHRAEYDAFVYIPYMFGTTYYGILVCPEKAVIIPCFHEEAYIHMDIYKKAFESVKGIIYLAEPEKETAHKVFDFSGIPEVVIGTGVETKFEYDAEAFREKFGIKEPFILYAGRKDVGKNVDVLLNYFAEYKYRNDSSDLKLVLIGGGQIPIPPSVKEDVIDLGFVDIQDKYNAYAAASMLCQPSTHESFSIVIMESWLCERPVLVHEECDVTREFAKRSNGGLYFGDYYEFEECVDYILSHESEAKIMGQQGKEFVLENYDWDVVTRKIKSFIVEN
ncbi:glycosyltransferase family 4 protein [Butyrivibrio sp. WCD2001]|uniref:glycosyltransferase family 4 protein n=1 Tax=Butyrivibrio sp. WCD2001 TaxID=1280681 RepID=UPI000401B8B0|nr:glycosyltransferase family 4 protein [Butyrivibrio sp. WCD2001]